METDNSNISQNDLVETPKVKVISALASARSVQTPRFDENTTENIDFPFSKSFLKLDPKEKEKIFTKLYEEKLAFIRNKELKCVNSPILYLATNEEITKITEKREECLEQQKQQECKKQLTQRTTKALDKLPLHVDSNYTPSYDPLLNTNFNAQFTLLDTFKSIISKQLIENRASKRIRQLSEYLSENINMPGSSRLSSSRGRSSLSLSLQALSDTQIIQDLLTVHVEIEEEREKFTEKEEDIPIEYPEVTIEPHAIERPFGFYTPTIIEQYSLTPFSRTEVNAFIRIPVTPPDQFPVVKGEQPVNEIIANILPSSGQTEVPAETLSGKSSARSLKSKIFSSSILPLVSQQSKIIQYPREIRFIDSDPIAELQASNMQLPELDIEIGRSSILSMPAAAYKPMMLAERTKNVAPFEFVGLPDQFANTQYPKPLSGADKDDLRELEFDDDIDNIDVSYKPKMPSEFMTKPVETKNKSHIYSEAMADGQAKYLEKQKKQVQEIDAHIKAMNDLIHDKTLKVKTDDLQEYLR